MRICWFVPDDYKGGVFPVVVSVCRQARMAGHDARILMLCPPAGAIGNGRGLFIDSLHLPSHAPEAPERILAWVKKHQAEVLILNGCEEADPVIPYVPDNVRCLYAVHDTSRWYWNQAVHFQKELDAIVAVSEVVAQNVRPHLRDRVEMLSVVPNGTTFPAEPTPNEPRPDDLLFVGGDDPMKGVSDAREVWAALHKHRFQGRLHWCGETGMEFNRHLQSLAGRERVILHGRIPRARVFELACQCKVVLALTRAESFGMATLEAMSMGCVPVAWDIETGTKTLVEANVHGFFVRLGDYQAFASAVLQAVERHRELGASAILRARSEFTEEAMWKRYEQVLNRCLSGRNPVRPLAGKRPPQFKPRRRLGRLLPGWLWQPLRAFVTQNPRLAYRFRDLRRI